MGNEQSTQATPSDHKAPSTSLAPDSLSTQQRRSNRQKRCTCPLGHDSREACEADPKSSRYTGPIESSSSSESDTDVEVSHEAEAEVNTKMPVAPEKKRSRKAPAKQTEQPKKRSKVTREIESENENEDCDCGAGHESLVECEKEAKTKMIDVTMSIIIGSQGMVIINVGKDNLKQGFFVHRELLTLHSEYFCSLLSTKINTEVKDEDEKKIKVEKIEQSDRDLSSIPDTRSPSPSEGGSQIPQNGLREASISEEQSKITENGIRYPSSSLTSLGSPSPLTPSPSIDTALQNVLENDISSQSSLKTQAPVTTPPTPKATPAGPTVSEIHVPEINPAHFAAFLSFLYTNSMTPSIADLETSSTPHFFPTMYLLGCQLLAPSFINYIMEALRRDVQLSDGEWPSAEQAKHIYEITAAFTTLAGGTSKIQKDGVAMLKKFTASCMAANTLFERHAEGSPERNEWSKLFAAKPEIGMDVLHSQSSRWHARKPWDDIYRKEFLVEESNWAISGEMRLPKGDQRRAWSETEGVRREGV